MDDKKRGYWNDTHNFVIPARDAGIWEFYQVGEHKSYVKMHHFMETRSQYQVLG
ncbi:MAG: hypothetical protein LKM43_05705 [Wolbachia endosymbiont of Penenirmus auritus]|nr:hypothetical protein [Wolbachia endosymbiont of Penenirmus auritus]